MTRAEILDCLTDRPCNSCKFHESGRCERWDCVFEEKPEDAEDCADNGMTREEAIRVIKDHIDTYVVCHGEEDTVAVSIDNVDVEALDMAIKALSVEPCEDAISRKAVSDAMYELCGEGSLKDNPWRDNPHIDSIIYAIEHLPSVTPKQRWIPVNERLPEDRLYVLATYKYEYGLIDHGITWYSKAEDRWSTSREVIAWMPLPEPYKEESEVSE